MSSHHAVLYTGDFVCIVCSSCVLIRKKGHVISKEEDFVCCPNPLWVCANSTRSCHASFSALIFNCHWVFEPFCHFVLQTKECTWCLKVKRKNRFILTQLANSVEFLTTDCFWKGVKTWLSDFYRIWAFWLQIRIL